jgi:hypothetical protein
LRVVPPVAALSITISGIQIGLSFRPTSIPPPTIPSSSARSTDWAFRRPLAAAMTSNSKIAKFLGRRSEELNFVHFTTERFSEM